MIIKKFVMPFSRGVRLAKRSVPAFVLFIAAGDIGAITYDVGVADVLATDQPRVTFGLTNEADGTLIGPLLTGQAVLDTLASGILLGDLAYRTLSTDLIDYGQTAFAADYDGNGTVDADEQFVQYNEQGVAGSTLLDVHNPLGLRVDDSSGTQHLLGTDIRAFGDSSLSLGSYNAVVGMPAMIGHTIKVDMTASLDPDFHRVYWLDSMEEATTTSAASMNVNLRMVTSEYTDKTLIDAKRPDLLPTFADLPVIDDIILKHTGGTNSPGGQEVTNGVSLGLDTGAQTTIFSESLATSLGIDFVNTIDDGGDVIDYLEVGGIGGSKFMPIVYVDELLVPTDDGNFILWRDIAMGVLNIDGAPFDGVFGMNMLTTGYFAEVFLLEEDAHVFDQVVFDFTSADLTDTAVMRLDFFQDPVAVAVPEPNSLLLISLTGAAILSRRRR